MQCEMCGETIRGNPKLVRVEGAELQVCMKCEKFGTEVQQVRRKDVGHPASAAPGRAGPRRRQQFPQNGGNGICSITWKGRLLMTMQPVSGRPGWRKGLQQRNWL